MTHLSTTGGIADEAAFALAARAKKILGYYQKDDSLPPGGGDAQMLATILSALGQWRAACALERLAGILEDVHARETRAGGRPEVAGYDDEGDDDNVPY